jgi:hypothetical protein
MELFYQKVSDKKKREIEQNAALAEKLLGSFSDVFHHSENGTPIITVSNGSYQTGIFEAIVNFRQLYVLQIIRYWTELLWRLQNLAMEINGEDIPYFSEIFAMFYNDDNYLKTTKDFKKY